jgi:spore coat polysaccharide biosynthesis protein SpsF
MSSTRLPGKVLRDLDGRPMLIQQLERLRACRLLDDIVVATTTDPSDDPIAAAAAAVGTQVYRGSRDDVLGRLVRAAKESRADVVVRVTADCPLIDPGVTDRVVDELVSHSDSCDYASNVERRTYPRGLDVEALFLDTLLRVDRLAASPSDREHVTAVVRAPDGPAFLTRSVEDSTDNSDLRWTVDEERDFGLVLRLYEELNLSHVVRPYQELLDYVRSHPELANLNQGVETWDPALPSASRERE